MSEDVTQNDIDAIDARIAELATLADAAREQLRSLNAQSTSARFSVACYKLALVSCVAANKVSLWRGDGYSWQQILAHYYPGVELARLGQREQPGAPASITAAAARQRER